MKSWSIAAALLLAPLPGGGDGPGPGSPEFHLPFPPGRRFTCVQGPGGGFSHTTDADRHAFDFAMPVGSPVVACAGGRVALVRDDSDRGGAEESFRGHENRVVVDHGGGRFTRYLHLKKGSARVVEGEWVQAGAALAESGNTGYSKTPHLHVALTDVWGNGLPLVFAEVEGGLPVEKRAYASKNQDPSRRRSKGKEPEDAGDPALPATTNLPADAFAFNSVEITSVLPATFWDWDWTYLVEGRVTGDAKWVVFFVSGREDSASLAAVSAGVGAGGRFTLKLRLSEKADALGKGPFSYAFATQKADGSFWSGRMLPLVVLDRK